MLVNDVINSRRRLYKNTVLMCFALLILLHLVAYYMRTSSILRHAE